MSEEKAWVTWKERWKITNQNAEDIVKQIFRLKGTRIVVKKDIPVCSSFEEALDFAIELGWLKDCLNDTYKLTCSGLLMLAHQAKT